MLGGKKFQEEELEEKKKLTNLSWFLGIRTKSKVVQLEPNM